MRLAATGNISVPEGRQYGRRNVAPNPVRAKEGPHLKENIFSRGNFGEFIMATILSCLWYWIEESIRIYHNVMFPALDKVFVKAYRGIGCPLWLAMRLRKR